jgi:hypothetical protein
MLALGDKNREKRVKERRGRGGKKKGKKERREKFI